MFFRPLYSSYLGIRHTINKPETEILSILKTQLIEQFEQAKAERIKTDDSIIEFAGTNSLVGIEYKATVKIICKENYAFIFYSFSLVELILATFVVLLVSFFFGFFLKESLLIPLIILTVLFFIINFLFINTSLRNLIFRTSLFSEKNIVVLENEFINEILQLKKYQCVYCKKPLSRYDMVCKYCRSVNIESQTYTSNFIKYKDKQYKYFFIEQEKLNLR